MPDLIEILESFNRKERFFLIAQALNGCQENPAFTLSPEFSKELGKKVGVTIPEEPEKVFVAMDYHLNWVHASLVLACADEAERHSLLNLEGTTDDNQEDVDLLVAFKNTDERYHLIFIEAKAYDAKGFSAFEKSQLVSKVSRLEKIIRAGEKDRSCEVETHFCLVSGYEPQNLKSDDWPKWNGKPIPWMPLSLPEKRHVLNYSDFSIVKQERESNRKRFNSELVVRGNKSVDESQA